jgi:hypothetical protein
LNGCKVKPIKFNYQGYDSCIKESWTEVSDAFLISHRIVAEYDLNEKALVLYELPYSLKDKDVAEFDSDNDLVKSYRIIFDGFPNFKQFDITKPLTEIITNLVGKSETDEL